MKKRLLVTISFSFSIRYIYRTGLLHKLSAFVTPVVALTWNEAKLVEELRADGFEVHVIPESLKDNFYSTIRKKIDYWFDGYVLQSSSKAIQTKYLDQYKPVKLRVKQRLRKHYNQTKLYFSFYKRRVFEAEQKLLKENTNYSEMLKLVDKLNIDAVFTVTPFHTQEDVLLRACKDRGKLMITSILSFDNLTKRGWIPVNYDVYMVWNKHNYREAISFYPNAASDKNVFVVGAAQFDFYFDKKNLLEKSEWQELVGLPKSDRPVILYGGGPQRLFPNEPQYLKHILEAIDKKEISSDPLILFRCHPVDRVERWKDYVGEHPNLIYDESWTGKSVLTAANITGADIKKLCSTLAYCDVHINICSTMTVDGSAYNKPQIGPCYDEINAEKQHLLQNMYNQDHFKPIIATGGLLLARSKQQLVEHINNTIVDPAAYISKSRKILEEVITYTDGKCTDRVVDVIKQTLQKGDV